MIVGECITALLFPFVWPHVYAPILPAALHHFLDAPVPFVMGLHADGSASDNMQRMGSEATLCYVDIDRKTIQMPEELPLFPHRAEVMSELGAALDRFNVPHHSGSDHNGHTMDTHGSHVPGGGGCNANTGSPKMHSARAYLNRPFDFDPMTASCTLPSGQQAARRKHSQHEVLDWDRCSAPAMTMMSDATTTVGSGGTTDTRCPTPRGEAMQRLGTTDGNAADAVMPQLLSSRRNVGVVGSGATDELPIDHEQYCDDLRLNNTVREIFLNRFVQMFAAYEHFVIWPNQDRQQWLSNRESLQNFDKASFLSDQQQHHRPFLSRFLESQMFATLVDNKIMSVWDGEFDASLRLFDNRIKILRSV